MRKMTVDLDEGIGPMFDGPQDYRRKAEERKRIEALGGQIESQGWLMLSGRRVLRTNYLMPDDDSDIRT